MFGKNLTSDKKAFTRKRKNKKKGRKSRKKKNYSRTGTEKSQVTTYVSGSELNLFCEN